MSESLSQPPNDWQPRDEGAQTLIRKRPLRGGKVVAEIHVYVEMLIENNEAFLSELTKLFNQNQAKEGSLYITMKRYEGRTKPIPRKKQPEKESKEGKKGPKDKGKEGQAKEGVAGGASSASVASGQPSNEYKCLIRAHTAKKRISTIIAAKDVNKFQLAYSNLLKGNLYGLKKKVDKKKAGTALLGSGSKSKATQ